MYEACTLMRSFQTQTQLDTHFLSSLAVLHWTDVGQEYGDSVAVPCPVVYTYLLKYRCESIGRGFALVLHDLSPTHFEKR